ncbi:hypothetical protein [Paenibacillus xylanexedens]|uniref:hypothetical protein n=1 Tax=Paenibacillus xylanexedens TaxID=528191 RepID=UPI0011A32645|nr:hypothetical protein [Paenibacillus xylanexedens]
MSRLPQKFKAIQMNGLQLPAKQHKVHGVAQEAEMPEKKQSVRLYHRIFTPVRVDQKIRG